MPPVHSSGAGAPEGWCGPLGAGERLVCRSREEPPRRPECQVRRQGSSALGHGPAPSPTPGPPWSTAGAMRPPLLGSQDQGLVGHPVPGRYSWTPCAFPHHLSAQHPQKHKAGPSLGWDAHSPPTSLQGRSRGHAGWGGSSEAGATPTLCSPAPGVLCQPLCFPCSWWLCSGVQSPPKPSAPARTSAAPAPLFAALHGHAPPP